MRKMTTSSRRIGIFGASGSGKTTKALELVKDCKRLIVFDVLDDFTGKFTRITNFTFLKTFLIKNYAKGFRVAFVPPSGSEPFALSELCLFLKLLQRGYKEGKHQVKICLFVDELNVSYPLGYHNRNPQNGFSFVNLQGRHYGINVVGVSQRPSLVCLPFRANLSDVFIFRMADFNDIKAAVQMFGSAYRQQILDLPNYKYLYKNDQGKISCE